MGFVAKCSTEIGLCLCNAERRMSLKVSVLLQWVLLQNVPRRSAFVYAMPRGGWALRLACCFNGFCCEKFHRERPFVHAMPRRGTGEGWRRVASMGLVAKSSTEIDLCPWNADRSRGAECWRVASMVLVAKSSTEISLCPYNAERRNSIKLAARCFNGPCHEKFHGDRPLSMQCWEEEVEPGDWRLVASMGLVEGSSSLVVSYVARAVLLVHPALHAFAFAGLGVKPLLVGPRVPLHVGQAVHHSCVLRPFLKNNTLPNRHRYVVRLACYFCSATRRGGGGGGGGGGGEGGGGAGRQAGRQTDRDFEKQRYTHR